MGLKNCRSLEYLRVVIGPVVLRIGVALNRLVSGVHLKRMCVVVVIPAQMAESTLGRTGFGFQHPPGGSATLVPDIRGPLLACFGARHVTRCT